MGDWKVNYLQKLLLAYNIEVMLTDYVEIDKRKCSFILYEFCIIAIFCMGTSLLMLFYPKSYFYDSNIGLYVVPSFGIITIWCFIMIHKSASLETYIECKQMRILERKRSFASEIEMELEKY